jgi:3-dehydroquinate synthetase
MNVRKSLICGLQDEDAIRGLSEMCQHGLLTKEEYAFTLRANKEAIDESKSKGRELYESIQSEIIYSDGPPPFPTREMTEEEFKRMFKTG